MKVRKRNCEGYPCRTDEVLPAKKKIAGAVSYRLPRFVHDDICDFAMEHAVPLGEIVTLFLRHGLKAYQAGSSWIHSQRS